MENESYKRLFTLARKTEYFNSLKYLIENENNSTKKSDYYKCICKSNVALAAIIFVEDFYEDSNLSKPLLQRIEKAKHNNNLSNASITSLFCSCLLLKDDANLDYFYTFYKRQINMQYFTYVLSDEIIDYTLLFFLRKNDFNNVNICTKYYLSINSVMAINLEFINGVHAFFVENNALSYSSATPISSEKIRILERMIYGFDVVEQLRDDLLIYAKNSIFQYEKHLRTFIAHVFLKKELSDVVSTDASKDFLSTIYQFLYSMRFVNRSMVKETFKWFGKLNKEAYLEITEAERIETQKERERMRESAKIERLIKEKEFDETVDKLLEAVGIKE